MTKMNLCFLCVFNLLQDIHQFALRQIDVYLWQARAQKNTHHYLLITPYILIQTFAIDIHRFAARQIGVYLEAS